MSATAVSLQEPLFLIAEDDPDDRELLSIAFETSGLGGTIRFVEDGMELLDYLEGRGGFDRAQAPMPGVIVLDLNMPRMDGREALIQLKNHHKLSLIPVVVLTTSTDENDISGAYDAGANSYITKPTSFERLEQVVRTLHEYWRRTVALPPPHALG